MNVPDGIQSTVLTVMENAYLRAALQPTRKKITDLSGDERAGMLQDFEQAIACDVELLRAAFVQYAAGLASDQVSERLNDIELKPVVFDTAERESENGSEA